MTEASGRPVGLLDCLGLAFRDPEGFILAWHRQGHPYSVLVLVALALIALFGTACYGMLLGVPAGPEQLGRYALLYSAAAGISWAVPLPAVYILNSMTGLRLRPSTTFLAALVTAAWGGWALLAFLPIAGVFTLVIPLPGVLLALHCVVFALVGISMALVYGWQMVSLEPTQGSGRVWWLLLFVLLKVELLYALGLFQPYVA